MAKLNTLPVRMPSTTLAATTIQANTFMDFLQLIRPDCGRRRVAVSWSRSGSLKALGAEAMA